MSANSEGVDLPFPIGTTLSQNGTAATTDSPHLEGREYVVVDRDYSGRGARAYGGAGQLPLKTVRIVRNVSGITLMPRKLVTFKTGQRGFQVDGYCTTTAQEAYPVDEFLPYNVPTNDLFYIVVEGNAECLTDLAAGANNLLNAETVVVALTAVTSQSTTAGRIAPQDLTGATALLANQIQNRIGVNLTAKTTTNTNVATLVSITKKL